MAQSSYSSGPTDAPLIGSTIGANFDDTVTMWPERPALVSRHQNIRWSYVEMRDRIDALATGLLRRGVGRGDRVGVWSPNCAEWVLVQYATAKIGAILVNINPAYRIHELKYALDQSGVRLLFSAEAFKTSDYRAMLLAAQPQLPALAEVVFFESPAWDGLLADTDRDAIDAASGELSADDPINIQYTSGTTGFPKGATLSHRNILNNGFFVGELCGYSELDRICIPVPFYHCFGMVMGNLGATSHGACIVIPAPAFDPEATLTTVEQERCTSLYGVPAMFIAELAHPQFDSFDLSTLRTGIMAGAPCPTEVMKRVVTEMHMVEVSICYGMTETSPVSTQTRRDDPLELRVATVGRAGPHVEIKIVDPSTRQPVPRGQTGEFCTRGYSVMLGYWDEPGRTGEAIDDAGWMHTGDLATMDDDGYCRIVGRIKDMVIRGGENVYSREVEEFLHTHPDVLDTQVVGVPDARYGEELCACLLLRDGSTMTVEALHEYCAGQIAHFKIPRYLIVVDEFPTTVTGKVQKYLLREQAITALGLEPTCTEPTC